MRPRDEQKIEKTFASALVIIGQKGIVGLKMQELAKAAGMATGTLYIYFKDKNELMNLMYLHYTKQMQRNIWSEQASIASYPERFRQKWYNYLRFVELFPAEMVFLEQYHRSPFANENTLAESDNLLQPLVDIIEEGQQQGYLQQMPPNLILAFVCGSVQELVAKSADGSLPPVTNMTHFAWEMTWKAISK